MKENAFCITMLLLLTFLSCKKDQTNQQSIPIPNGNFEQWTMGNMPNLAIWKTNSCPVCVPPYETYIVQKATDAENGQFAARFIYNGVYRSYATNTFSISAHPSLLTGFVKSTIASGDSATIRVDLFSGNMVVDSGNFYETSSNAGYRKIEILISQNTANVDSAQIIIVGGKKQTTELFVDNLLFK